MNILDLDSVRKHLRIDSNCEDDVLEMYIDSAEETILQLIRRTQHDLIEEYGEVPAPVRHAIMLLVSHSYNNREPASATSQAIGLYGFEVMLKPYMRLC